MEFNPMPPTGGYTQYSSQPTQKQPRHVRVSTLILCMLAAAILVGVSVWLIMFHSQQVAANASADATVSQPSDALTQPSATQQPTLPDGSASSGITAAQPSTAVEKASNDVLEHSMASIVGITVQTTSNMSGEATDAGSGSGVIITADGYILTCNHVVSGADGIKVCLQDQSEYPATVIGADSQSDLAVIKIDATNLPAATLGNSSQLSVGDTIYAIGNPLGEFLSSVTEGIISGLDRTVTIEGITRTLMQVDAAVNPGNSGGGLFDANGNLVGIVNAKSTGVDVEGIGFAIPIDTAKTIASDLMDYGYVTGRPYLGVTVQTIYMRSQSESEQPYGFSFGYGYGTSGLTSRVQVVSVEANGSAAKAGIVANDILYAVNGEEITSASQLTSKLYEHAVGDEVTISVLRGNETVDLSVTLGARGELN